MSHGWGLLDSQAAQAALGPLAHRLAAGLLALSPAGKLLYLNEAAERLLGIAPGTMLGQPLARLLADEAGIIERLPTAATAGEALRLTPRMNNGAVRVLLATPQQLDGWYVLTLQDISEEHQAQERLVRLASNWARRNLHLALLQRPTLDIAAQPDLATTLEAIGYRAARLVEADGSAILLRDELGTTLHVAASWACGCSLNGLSLAADQGLVGQALASGLPQRHTTATLAEGNAPHGPLIVIPLQYRDGALGALAVFRQADGQAFSEDDELLLGAISAQAALAIGNVRLYDETRESLAQLETLTGLLEAINSQVELQPLLERIIEGAARLFDAEVGTISLWDEQSGTAQVTASFGLPELIGLTIAPGGLGIGGLVLASGKPVIVNDTYGQLLGTGQLNRPVDHALGAAISWQGRVVGLVMVGSTSRRFSERDAGPLTLFAKHAAIAIEKARLFATTRSLAGALSSSEIRLRAIIDNMPALVYLADAQHGILLANQPFAQLAGYDSPDEMIGKMTSDLFAPDEAAALSVNNRTVLEQGAKIVVEESIGQGEHKRSFLSVKFPVRDATSGVMQLGGVAVDITERKQNEERLRLLAALEERQKLARELHDSVTQTLFSMSLNARATERALGSNPQQAVSLVAELRRLAQGALAEMRALIFELRPESLESEGLVAALAKHTAALMARHEITVRSEVDGEPAIDLAAKEACYRIAQEAMHNVVKHANATTIWLSLRHEDTWFVMQVRDDGCGFEVQGTFPGHLGLTSMRERAARVGATIEVVSRPGHGTTITTRLPTKTA